MHKTHTMRKRRALQALCLVVLVLSILVVSSLSVIATQTEVSFQISPAECASERGSRFQNISDCYLRRALPTRLDDCASIPVDLPEYERALVRCRAYAMRFDPSSCDLQSPDLREKCLCECSVGHSCVNADQPDALADWQQQCDQVRSKYRAFVDQAASAERFRQVSGVLFIVCVLALLLVLFILLLVEHRKGKVNKNVLSLFIALAVGFLLILIALLFPGCYTMPQNPDFIVKFVVVAALVFGILSCLSAEAARPTIAKVVLASVPAILSCSIKIMTTNASIVVTIAGFVRKMLLFWLVSFVVAYLLLSVLDGPIKSIKNAFVRWLVIVVLLFVAMVLALIVDSILVGPCFMYMY